MTAGRHIEIFYTDPTNGWAVALIDADGNQVDEAAYHWLRADAIDDTVGTNLPVHVFAKTGDLQRVIAATPRERGANGRFKQGTPKND